MRINVQDLKYHGLQKIKLYIFFKISYISTIGWRGIHFLNFRIGNVTILFIENVVVWWIKSCFVNIQKDKVNCFEFMYYINNTSHNICDMNKNVIIQIYIPKTNVIWTSLFSVINHICLAFVVRRTFSL